MTRQRQDVNRRTVLLVTACTLSTGLAGCLGGSDDDTGEGDGDDQQNGTDDTDDDSEEFDPEADQELAEQFAEDVLAVLNESNVEGYNELLHSSAQLQAVPEDESALFGPQFEAENPTVVDRDAEELVVGVDVEYELGTDQIEQDWELVFRDEAGEWKLWDIDTGDLINEPALSPEVVVADFVEALDAGDAEAVDALLFEDGNPPETIVENTEQYEGIIELDGTDVTERETGQAAITTTVTIRHDGGTEQITWNLVLGVVDGEWQIGFSR